MAAAFASVHLITVVQLLLGILLAFWYALQAYVLGASAYILSSAGLFLLFSASIKRQFTRPDKRSGAPAARTNFMLLIPAHNEERLLPALLASTQRLNYPAARFCTVVVADNCTDRTAHVARQAGAVCLERHTPEPSDKAQALRHAHESRLLIPGFDPATVVCIVDADCVLEASYLAELDRLYAQPGAAPVVQAYRSVSNAFASDVAVLDAAAEALRQWVQSGTRQWLGQDAFLFGLGSSMRAPIFAALMALPSTSLAEDKEWKVWLTANNLRVAYCPTARLSYEVVSDARAFQQQRSRWLMGYYQSLRSHGISMLVRGIRGGSLAQLDLAGELLQPPRSLLVLAAALFWVLAQGGGATLVSSWVWPGIILAFGLYSGLGLRLIGAQPRHYLLLFTSLKLIGIVVKASSEVLLGRGVKGWAATRRKSPKAT